MALLKFKKYNRQIAYAPPSKFTLTVDKNGYIGDKHPADSYTHYCFKEVTSDYSESGLGQVTLLKWTKIGDKEYVTGIMPDGKEWMCENLDFQAEGINVSTAEHPIIGSPTTATAWYYNNDEATYGREGKKYGLLYNWYAAMTINIDGWHVPSSAEWDALATACGGASTCGTKLKSTYDWSSGTGTDNYGFNGLPSGNYADSIFYNVGNYAVFWTSDEYDDSSVYYRYLSIDATMISDYSNKASGLSLRLIKNY